MATLHGQPRLGTILAVADFERPSPSTREHLGFAVDARYDDPSFATLSQGVRALPRRAGPSVPRPAVASVMIAPADPSRLPVRLVLWVDDVLAVHRGAGRPRASRWPASRARRPGAACRFFVRDPDGYLVEFEQPAA